MSNPQQVLTAAVGTTIGFLVGGGPAGALKGFQLGVLAGSVLFPPDLPDGPRLEDFEQLQADPGAPLVVVHGTEVASGFRLYLGPVGEVSTEESVGKGGPEQTTFQYFQTLSLGLCEGVISGVAFIYENGELVYDVRPQGDDESAEDFDSRLAMSAEYAQTFVLYRGTERQMPDPTIELIEGAGQLPAFRGLAYMVWPDRELKPEQGNRHPSFKIGVVGRGELLLTSRAYPYYFEDTALGTGGSIVRGDYPPLWRDEVGGIGGALVSGSLDNTLVEYVDWPPDEVDGTGGELVAGTMVAPIVEYVDWPVDEVDATGGELVSGTMIAPVVEYVDWPPDEAAGTGGNIISGTMTT